MKKHKKDKKNATSKIVLKVLLIFGFVLLVLFFVRSLSARHLDDIHPNITCDEKLLQKADILYVIPKFENVNISDNSEWCKKILSYNKTLALHGVYHIYKEFATDRDKDYIQEGAEEFFECFGFYPTHFKAPQTIMSVKNNALLIDMGYKVDSLFGDTFHKVYHCNDQGFYPNWVSDLI